METKILIALLLPLVSLLILLGWVYLVVLKRPDVILELNGFGVTISLDSRSNSLSKLIERNKHEEI